MSYNGRADIAMMGDYDAVGDLEEFGADIRESMAELRSAAAQASGRVAKPRTKAPQTT